MISSQIYLNQDSTFVQSTYKSIEDELIKEDVAAAIADFNGDSKNDILIGSGGADFYGEANPLLDSYFIQNDATYVKAELPNYFQNASVIKPYDFDNDGDLDVFVGGHTVSGKFGIPATSYLLQNDEGTFSILKNFGASNEGMITDAIWDDYNNDGTKDLILVGEWMTPKFFKNQNGNFTEEAIISNTVSGLWQAIEPFDIDQDGDMDYVLGNWGLNSKFKASKKSPLKLIFGDFDKNGQTETITAIEKNGDYYTISGLDELSSQLVFLKKKFNSYKDFAGKKLEEIIDKKMLADSRVLEVNELQSGYLKNEDGKFTFIPFKSKLQVSPIMAFLSYDFDNDTKNELLIGGNFFGVKPYHGRFDSFPGALLRNENNVILGNEIGLDFTQKSIRHLNTIILKNKAYLMVTFNNDAVQVYQIMN